MTMQAPFPYFGGKSEIASVIWDGLGDVRFYLEPHARASVLQRIKQWLKNRPLKRS